MRSSIVSSVPAATAVRVPAWRMWLLWLRRGYVVGSVLFVNTLVLYVLMNVVLGGIFWWRDRGRTNPVTETYGAQLDAVYPDFPDPDRTQMLSECWNRPYRYADYIHFSEQSFAGRFVNVHEAGFRHVAEQGTWPPDLRNFNVFCFGGSTMFGYGLPDDQTFASQLQGALNDGSSRPVRVYNFGVGWHYSTQERIRFERLLGAGFVPDVALFLDGINDCSLAHDDQPAFSPNLAAAFENVQAWGVQSPGKQAPAAVREFREWFYENRPVGRLGRRLSGMFSSESTALKTTIKALTPEQAQRGVENFRWNRELILAAAQRKNVKVLFLIQPAPGYHHNPAKHPFANRLLCANEVLFYEKLRTDLGEQPDADGVAWCADLVDQFHGPIYVDTCHYSAAFSLALANDVARRLRANPKWLE